MRGLVRFITVTTVALTAFTAGRAQAGALPGDLLVSDFSAFGGNGAVIIVHPVTGVQTPLSIGGLFRDPWDITVDNSVFPARIFVSDIVADAIIEVDPGTGAQLLVSAGGLLTNPTGVEVGMGTDLWVTDSGNRSVVRVDKNTGAQVLVYSGAPFVSPFGVGINKFGDVYVIDRVANAGSVYQMVGGVPVLVSSGASFAQPYGMTIDSGSPAFPANEPGGIWVADRNAAGGNGALFYIDPNTGAKTLESNGQLFSEPSGVTFGVPAVATQVFVSDYVTRRVISVDPSLAPNANQTLISGGGVFGSPAKIAVYPEQPVQNQQTTWGRVKGQYR